MDGEIDAEPSATPYTRDARDFGNFSDHITVWIDTHIGVEGTYEELKTKFTNNIQVLETHDRDEEDIDDDSIAWVDTDILNKLKDDVYCLKAFSTPQRGLKFILEHPQSKIFFISSGTIGKVIVPEIADLAQIQGIYIFCGHIASHKEWAMNYIEKISAMLEHQDDLLVRLTKDIAEYVEKKGDEHQHRQDFLQARNCYAWAKKLLLRGKNLGDRNTRQSLERIDEKIKKAQSISSTEDQQQQMATDNI